jgi:hypothetical protein
MDLEVVIEGVSDAELSKEIERAIREDLAWLGFTPDDEAPRQSERDDAYHYSLLIVRGGKPVDDFSGQLTLEASILSDGRPAVIALPDDQPDAAAALKLKFKYYQRIEGTLRIPPGSQLRALQAKVMETGQPTPKATRSLNLS